MRRGFNKFARIAAALSLLAGGGSAVAAPIEPAATGTSEHDYLAELPVVLSVSRLAQPLDETPGAVTVIDRDMIRRSGAREPAELLRLVPGFLVGGFNGANPVAAYHAAFNPYGTHLQVFVDGRSVYSTYFLGDTHRGLMGVVLEDIERIEVLRGSNSAAYGANAFLGVVNIVTRNAADTRGGMVAVTGGERGVDDNAVRVGFGNERAAFRATLTRRADSGLDRVNDDKRLGQFHLRGDLRPTPADEITLLAGAVNNSYGDGLPGRPENAERTAAMDSSYVNGKWRRDTGQWGEFQVSASIDHERIRDRWPYSEPLDAVPFITSPTSLTNPTSFLIPPGATINSPLDFGGSSRRAQVEAQQSLRLSPALRVVWGGGYRHEQVKSAPVYYRDDAISSHQWRWFGNAEWRPHEQWLVNAGGLWERHSIVGSAWAPRLSASFHLTPGQTFRFGATRSQRAPTLYELRGDTRFFDTAPYLAAARSATIPVPVPPALLLVPAVARYNATLARYIALLQSNWQPAGGSRDGILLANTVRATGQMQPENLLAHEIGYLGEFRRLNLTLDVRAFHEVIDSIARTEGYMNAGLLYDLEVLVDPTKRKTNDYRNGPGNKIYGWEYQARWRPFAATRVILNQSFIRIDGPADEIGRLNAPTHLTSLAWFQDLPADFNASVMYSTTGAMIWATRNDLLKSEHQIDLRLAKNFRIGPTRGEVAWTVQQASGRRQEYLPTYSLDRRAHATLRLEF